MVELIVLKHTRRLIKFVYNLQLPYNERYNLESQIRRASVSIALNLREGNSLPGKNKVRFFNIAMGSLAEVDECLKIMLDLDFCNRELYDKFQKDYYWVVFNKIKKLISSLSTTPSKARSEATPK